MILFYTLSIFFGVVCEPICFLLSLFGTSGNVMAPILRFTVSHWKIIIQSLHAPLSLLMTPHVHTERWVLSGCHTCSAAWIPRRNSLVFETVMEQRKHSTKKKKKRKKKEKGMVESVEPASVRRLAFAPSVHSRLRLAER